MSRSESSTRHPSLSSGRVAGLGHNGPRDLPPLRRPRRLLHRGRRRPRPDAPQRPARLGRPGRRGARATESDDFGYANLAIRGRKLGRSSRSRSSPRSPSSPTWSPSTAAATTCCVRRSTSTRWPAAYDDAIGRLSATGARVVMFTIFDPGGSGIYGPMRGRMAIFNEWVREIADTPRRHRRRHVADARRRRSLPSWTPTGCTSTAPATQHMAPRGPRRARRTPRARGRRRSSRCPTLRRREQLAANARWTREFLVPLGAPPGHRPVVGRHRLPEAAGPRTAVG